MFDWRDTMVRMAMLYRSGQLIGIDSNSAFEEVASIASSPMAERLRSFASRAPEERLPAKFGFKESRNSAGEFIYEAVRDASVLHGRTLLNEKIRPE